jgi:prepilin-type processing-associated H-X9-DG protein
LLVVVLLTLIAAPVLALEREGDREGPAAERRMPAAAADEVREGDVAPPVAEMDMDQLLQDMGMGEKERMLFQLMTQPGMDPMMMLMLMGAMEGNMDGDLMGMMFFSKLMEAGKAGPPQPATILKDNTLIIVDDGAVYQVDTETLRLLGKLEYRPKAQAANPLAMMLPLIAGLRAEAGQRAAIAMPQPGVATGVEPRGGGPAKACQRNVMQMCQAALAFARDNDNTLPGTDWPVTLGPYIRNTELYKCPALEGVAIGFVINEKVAGVKLGDIQDPANTILFFESDFGIDMPIGGPEAVIAAPRHDETVTVGYLDGHVAALSVDQVKEALAK